MQDPARFEARLAPETLALVKRAAELRGCSVQDFIAFAINDAAERLIEAAHIVRLSPEDQAFFAQLLLEPPALAPAIERARAAHSALIGRRT